LKRLLLLVIVISTVFVLFANVAQAAKNEAAIKVNGVAITPEIPPLAVSGRVMVPIQAISDALGAKLAWNSSERVAKVVKSGHVITFKVGSKTATIDKTQSSLSVPPMLIEGTVLVPARFISEALGAGVAWDTATSTVSITLADAKEGSKANDIYNQAIANLLNAKTYSFTGNVNISGKTQSILIGTDSASISMNLEGIFRSPKETYTKLTLNAGEAGSGILPGLESGQEEEMYTDGISIYEKSQGEGWIKSDMSPSLSVLDGENQDPTTIIDQLNAIPHSIVFGDDAIVNGTSHYTIILKPDPNGVKDYVAGEIEKLSKIDGAGGENTEVMQKTITEGINRLLADLRMDITNKIYVDKQTLNISNITSQNTFSFMMEGAGSISACMDLSLDVFGINEPVTMPDVKALAK
jgi:hypothetical protein